jgi:DNA polymerase/3'-5' exonuclease PolX
MKTIDILQRALAARDRLMADERILHAEITGSVRRGLLEVGDLDLLIVTEDPWAFHPSETPRRPQREAHLFVATPETYGAVLAFSTGPRKLNRILREKAHEKGYLFDFASDGSDGTPVIEAEHGPFIGLYALDATTPTPTPTPTRTEEQFFRLVGVPHVPPPFREWLTTQS